MYFFLQFYVTVCSGIKCYNCDWKEVATIDSGKIFYVNIHPNFKIIPLYNTSALKSTVNERSSADSLSRKGVN